MRGQSLLKVRMTADIHASRTAEKVFCKVSDLEETGQMSGDKDCWEAVTVHSAGPSPEQMLVGMFQHWR